MLDAIEELDKAREGASGGLKGTPRDLSSSENAEYATASLRWDDIVATGNPIPLLPSFALALRFRMGFTPAQATYAVSLTTEQVQNNIDEFCSKDAFV